MLDTLSSLITVPTKRVCAAVSTTGSRIALGVLLAAGGAGHMHAQEKPALVNPAENNERQQMLKMMKQLQKELGHMKQAAQQERVQHGEEVDELEGRLTQLEQQNAELMKAISSNGEDGFWDHLERLDIFLNLLFIVLMGIPLFRYFYAKYHRHYPIMTFILNMPSTYREAENEESPYTHALVTHPLDTIELEDLNRYDRNLFQKAVANQYNLKHIEQLPTEALRKLFGDARKKEWDYNHDPDSMSMTDYRKQQAANFLPIHKDSAAMIRRTISRIYGDDIMEQEEHSRSFNPDDDRRTIYFAVVNEHRNSERKMLRVLILSEDRFDLLPDQSDFENCWVRAPKLRHGRLPALSAMKTAVADMRREKKEDDSTPADMCPYVWAHKIPKNALPKDIVVAA